MALLPKLDVIAGESLTSFLNRVARFHCNVGLSQFLNIIELSQQDAMLPEPATLVRISALTGQPPEVLARMAFVRTGTRQRIIADERVGEGFFTVSKRRFCSTCLVEDGQFGSESHGMPVGRLAWQIEPIRICDLHGQLLQGDDIQSFANRFLSLPELKSDMAQLDAMALAAEKREPTSLQNYIMNRICGKSGPAWLDGQQMDLASRACEMLGIVIVQGSGVDLKSVTNEQWCEAGDIGYGFASRGKTGIYEGLKTVYDRHIRSGKSGGPQKAFGRLFQWLQYHRNDKSRGSIREVVREFILDHFPFEIGFNLFAEPVREVRVHTVTSLSRLTKLHPVSLRHAAEVAGLIEIREGGGPAHQIFPAEMGEDLAKRMRQSMPTNALSTYLNCNRVQSEQLVRTGIIPRILTSASVKGGILTNVGIDDVDEFLKKLLEKAEKRCKTSDGMADIITASQRTHVPVVDIVKAILAGDLTKVEILDPNLKFKGLLVDTSEIRKVISCVKTPGFVWKSEAAHLLGLNAQDLSKLADMRHANGSPIFTVHFEEAEGLQAQQMIDLKDVHAFQSEYILLKEYASHLQQTPSVVSMRLKELGVEAIASHPRLSRKIYRRADIPL